MLGLNTTDLEKLFHCPKLRFIQFFIINFNSILSELIQIIMFLSLPFLLSLLIEVNAKVFFLLDWMLKKAMEMCWLRDFE